MEEAERIELERFAKEIRLHTVKSLAHLGFGHYGGSLSIADVLAVLYGGTMNVEPHNPQKPDRDYFILSKGHAGPALYAALALRDFFPLELLKELNRFGSNLPSHPDRLLTPGVDMTTGSLGQGISVACGIAKSIQTDNTGQWVYCVVGDGELNEGQCWEAVQFAAHHELDHLILFLDENKRQLDGRTEEICKGLSYEEKFKAFGLDTVRVSGDNVEEIYNSILNAKADRGRPHMIILDTIKGSGFPYLEQKADNHHVRPTEEESLIIAEYIKKLEMELGGGIDA